MTHSFESHAETNTESPEFDQSSIFVSSELKDRISRASELCKNLDGKAKRLMMITTKASVRAASMLASQATAVNDAIFSQSAPTFEEYKKAA